MCSSRACLPLSLASIPRSPSYFLPTSFPHSLAHFLPPLPSPPTPYDTALTPPPLPFPPLLPTGGLTRSSACRQIRSSLTCARAAPSRPLSRMVRRSPRRLFNVPPQARGLLFASRLLDSSTDWWSWGTSVSLLLGYNNAGARSAPSCPISACLLRFGAVRLLHPIATHASGLVPQSVCERGRMISKQVA